MLLCLITTKEAVADVVVDGLVYSLDGNEATIVNYTNSMPSDLIIPETIQYNGASYTVTCIGSHKYSASGWAKTGAFYGCTWLKSIVIPASVSSITGEYRPGSNRVLRPPGPCTEIPSRTFHKIQYGR